MQALLPKRKNRITPKKNVRHICPVVSICVWLMPQARNKPHKKITGGPHRTGKAEGWKGQGLIPTTQNSKPHILVDVGRGEKMQRIASLAVKFTTISKHVTCFPTTTMVSKTDRMYKPCSPGMIATSRMWVLNTCSFATCGCEF